jgi:imidazolonepropionase-like amidohydrolase
MSVLLNGAIVLDGTGADPVAGSSVLIEGDRIADVGPRVQASGAEVIDLTGLTVLPGLIDAHVHVGHSSEIRAVLAGELSVAERAADIFRNLAQTLQAGFTTIRDCAGLDLGVIRAVARGLVPGPRIWSCGPGLCQCGGHGHLASPFLPPDDPYKFQVRGLTGWGQISDGPDEVRKAARECFRQGASFLKMAVTGGVISFTDSLRDTQFTVEEIAAAVAEASARHTYVTVHAHNAAGIRNAIEAGVKCVEHGTGTDDEIAALMARHRVHLVPTLAIARVFAEEFDQQGLPEQVRSRLGDTEKLQIAGLLAARDAGVLIGSGSDLIGPNQNRRGLEIALKAQVIGAMDAIVSATQVNAKIMGIEEILGTLSPGKYADLIAVDFDPLAEPDLFDSPGRVVLVVKGGAVVKDTRAQNRKVTR